MKDYIEEVKRTESNDFDSIKRRISNNSVVRMLHSATGIVTEAGELLDALKKHIFYGSEIDTTNLKEEAGDLFWYLALLCDELGVSFEEVQKTNIKKLKARYPEKFTQDNAENRNLDEERKILEK